MVRIARLVLPSLAVLSSLFWLVACSDGQREVVGPGVIGSSTEFELAVGIENNVVTVTTTADCVLDPNASRILIDVNGPPPPGEIYQYEVSLKMRRQRHRAVVSIYDQATGGMLSGAAEVSP